MIKQNDRVRWFENCSNMNTSKSGMGIVINVEHHPVLNDYWIVNILCDDGNIKYFPIEDIRLIEAW
jgi:hypothetical protein